MHKDVLEFFIIANSVPVLHLFQSLEGEADSVLRAGRISAQDILGEETTGELIQKEVLSNSTIYYGRSQEILVALRVTSSMSDLGTISLLKKALALCDNYRELIFRSFGDRDVLRPLTERLDLLLGTKLPTNPVVMGKINKVMSDVMENLNYIDRIAIVTAEGWMVNILENNREQLGKVSKFAWKNAVEMLHLTLGLANKNVIVTDEDSIWFLSPLRFSDPQNPDGVSWWGLISQINQTSLQHQTSDLHLISEKIQKEIDENLVKIVGPLVTNMLEKESRLFGLTGPLGKLFSLPEYLEEKPIMVEINERSIQVFEERASGKVKVLEKTADRDFISELFNLLDSVQPSAAFFTLSETEVVGFAQQLISLEHHEEPVTISFGNIPEQAILEMCELIQSDPSRKFKILSEGPLNLTLNKGIDLIQVSSQAQVGGYFAVFVDHSTLLIAIKDANQKYFTLFSNNLDFMEFAKSTIQQLIYL